MCTTLKQIKNSCPQDFNRPPRSLKELNFFKATEFRRLCMYDGVRVFKEIPDENLYKHYASPLRYLYFSQSFSSDFK